ncbi:MAG: hypothetical protein ABIT76_01990 [Chthoniobacterales bacterium]
MPKKATPKPVKKAAPKAAAKKIVKAAAPAKPVKAAKATKPVKAAPAKTAPAKATKPAPAKVSKTGPKKGRGRVTSPSGPLSAAVVSVLKRSKRPLSCAEITEALIKKNYQFTHPEPKRIVSIRIYKLKGVEQTGPGRFTAAAEEN